MCEWKSSLVLLLLQIADYLVARSDEFLNVVCQEFDVIFQLIGIAIKLLKFVIGFFVFNHVLKKFEKD